MFQVPLGCSHCNSLTIYTVMAYTRNFGAWRSSPWITMPKIADPSVDWRRYTSSQCCTGLGSSGSCTFWRCSHSWPSSRWRKPYLSVDGVWGTAHSLSGASKIVGAPSGETWAYTRWHGPCGSSSTGASVSADLHYFVHKELPSLRTASQRWCWGRSTKHTTCTSRGGGGGGGALLLKWLGVPIDDIGQCWGRWGSKCVAAVYMPRDLDLHRGVHTALAFRTQGTAPQACHIHVASVNQ